MYVHDGSLSDSATIYVRVLDANDNAPIFSMSEYMVEVTENINGVNVCTVEATDLDLDERGLVTYSITGKIIRYLKF